MIERLIYAVIVAVVVWLICILLGMLLVALPPVAMVGAFLQTYGWIIGLLAGLLYFLSGRGRPF